MSTNPSETTKLLQYEKEFTKFLTKRIGRGSIKLQHITGHLADLRPEVRNTIGTSESHILNFIENHTDIFNIDNGIVTLVNDLFRYEDCDSDTRKVQGSLPSKISNGIGVIAKLRPTWGIINIKEPIKTSAYFSAKHFLLRYKEEVNLTDYGLNVGTMVIINAVREKDENFTTKYHATKVKKKEEVDASNNIHIPRKSCKTGLYDPMNLDGEGVIQKVFKEFGFIVINDEENNTVFFCKNSIVNYDNISDLNKLFEEGDLVEFSAERTSRQDTRARWIALKVWKKSSKIIQVKTQVQGTSSKLDSNINDIKKSCTNSVHLTEDIKQKETEKEIIYNESGKICPRSKSTVIKFGENFSQLADGNCSVYYIFGTEVTDISWVFSEGEDIQFDAVKIKSAPGWRAILVWKGDKPNVVLPTCLTDFSAFNNDEEENCEITKDISSSVLGSHLSLNSHGSEKSSSVKSEFGCESDRSSEVKDFINNNKTSKQSKFSPFQSSSQSKLPLSRQLISSGKSEKEISSRNVLNNIACKPVLNSSYIPECESVRSTISSIKGEYFTSIQDDKLKNIGEYSGTAVNVKEQNSDCRFIRSSNKLIIDNSLKNIGSLDFKDNIEIKARIKMLQDVVGEIITVYSTYAKVKSSKMQSPATFSRKYFYWRNKSMKNLKLQDLREILQVGDKVHLDYFEIVDNLGQAWNKVSLAWSGPKLSWYQEKTINDIIQEVNLFVTVNKESNTEQQKQTVKKYVTTIDEISDLKNIYEHISRTESCSDDSGDDCNNTFHSPLSCQIPGMQIPLADEIKRLSDMISQKILKNKGLLVDPKVDFDSLSTEIANLSIKQLNYKESTDGTLNTLLTEEQSHDKTYYAACSYKKDIAEKSLQTDTDEQTRNQNMFNAIMLTILSFLLLKHFFTD